MTQAEAQVIRDLVLRGGWVAVRECPVAGPVWAAHLIKNELHDEELEGGVDCDGIYLRRNN